MNAESLEHGTGEESDMPRAQAEGCLQENQSIRQSVNQKINQQLIN